MAKKNDHPKRKPTGNYKVGFAAPPREHCFPKGHCGNPRGRPKKPKDDAIVKEGDIIKLLSDPLTVQQGGKPTQMHPYEIEVRRIAKKALQEQDLKSIAHLLKLFSRYGVLPSVAQAQGGGVITLPNIEGVPFQMALTLNDRFGPPPWSDEELAAVRSEYEKDERAYWEGKRAFFRDMYKSRRKHDEA